MSNEQNLIMGRVSGTLVKFALPPLAANLLQSSYSIVDMLIVGNVVGETGLAAISDASMVSSIISSICIGITMGGMVLVAQYKGVGDEEGQRGVAGTLFSIAFIASIIAAVLGLLLYGPVFQTSGAPAVSTEDAYDHMKVICGGMVLVFGCNAVCSILKGYGDSKTSLYFIAAVAVINTVLDMLLVRLLGIGTKGVTYVTIFSQGISLLTSILHLRKGGISFDSQWKRLQVHRDKLVMILEVGLPLAVQMVIVNISYLLITGILNRFGVSVTTASGIELKVSTFAGIPCWATGQVVAAIVGQNMGTGNLQRVEETVRTGLRFNTLVTLAAALFVQIFAGPIIALFEPGSLEVFIGGILYLRVCCGMSNLIYTIMHTLGSFVIGIDSVSIAMVSVLLDVAIVRLPLGFSPAFVADIGLAGTHIGQVVSPALPVIVSLLCFKSGIWERKSLTH